MARKQAGAPHQDRQIGAVVPYEVLRRIEEQTGQKSPFYLTEKQQEANTRTERIIGVGGAKFGGKTAGGMRWMVSGNKHTYKCSYYRLGLGHCDCEFPDYDKEGNPLLINWSYINHPKFLGCVIRENSLDLRNWVAEAKPIYRMLGGEYKEGNGEFVFPSGATIFTGHFQTDDAFTKYAGQNIVRFLVEEATHIPNVRRRIQMLNSCCRSVFPEMKAQLMLTFNPGGVSHGDILDMFVKPRDANGNPIPPGTTITEEYDAQEIYDRLGVPKPPEVGDKIVSTRVFIFSSIKDNPHALTNQDYIAALMDMDEEEREAYLFGNWDILAGNYFQSYRPNGPLRGEPPEACHVIPFNIAKNRIQPWWWRTMSCDYGYHHECVTLWGAKDESTGQLIIADEMCVSKTEPDAIGEEIARRSVEMLRGLQQPMVTMGLSHDAYGTRQDDQSIAELIARGLARILGKNMVHLPDIAIDRLKEQMENEGQSTRTDDADKIFDAIRSQQRMGITIRRMRDNRVVGWQTMRSMMRWQKTLPDFKEVFDPNLASRIAYEKGLEQYNAYMNLFKQKPEVLPKLLIVGPPVDGRGVPISGTGLGCSRLIAAIPKAVRDDTNIEDVTRRHIEGASDLLDSARYLVMTFRNQVMPEPYEALRQRTVAVAREHNPNIDTQSLVFVNRRLEADWKQKNSVKPIHIIRPGRSMRARTLGLLGPGPN